MNKMLDAEIDVLVGKIVAVIRECTQAAKAKPSPEPQRPLNRPTLEGDTLWLADSKVTGVLCQWSLGDSLRPYRQPEFVADIAETCRQAEIIAVKKRNEELLNDIKKLPDFPPGVSCEFIAGSDKCFGEVQALIRKGAE